MRFILSKKRRLMGECTPRFYRVAWFDFMRGYDVCYPIGIHLIARGIRRLWEWSHRYNESKLELLVCDATGKALERDRKCREKHEARIREEALREGENHGIALMIEVIQRITGVKLPCENNLSQCSPTSLSDTAEPAKH